MPHPEREHELMIEVARLLRERDTALAQETYWHNRATEARADLEVANAKADAAEAALAAARRECEGLRAAMVEIRDRSNHGDFPEAMRIADAALAAPAAGEEGKR